MARNPFPLGRVNSLLVTGGGTGGHVIPALTILEEARRRGVSVLYAGAPESLEERQAAKRSLPFFPVRVSGFAGKGMRDKIQALSILPKAIGVAGRQIRSQRPDLVIGTGGYVQIPWIMAAGLLRIPVVLLEPNAVSGWSNRILSPFAQIVSTMDTRKAYGGVPVPEIPSPGGEERFAEPLRIVIAGGSQGARALNDILPPVLLSLSRLPGFPRFEVLHQCGERWVEATRERYSEASFPVEVAGFLDHLPESYREASLVICRSGALTVTEVTAAGAPAVYIPYPHAIGDHQTANAERIARFGGGWLFKESALSLLPFQDFLKGILSEPRLLSETGKAASLHSPAIAVGKWLERLSPFWGNLSNV